MQVAFNAFGLQRARRFWLGRRSLGGGSILRVNDRPRAVEDEDGGEKRADEKPAVHLSAAIESTRMVIVFASSVPVTRTFCAAYFSGVFWSLRKYALLPS